MTSAENKDRKRHDQEQKKARELKRLKFMKPRIDLSRASEQEKEAANIVREFFEERFVPCETFNTLIGAFKAALDFPRAYKKNYVINILALGLIFHRLALDESGLKHDPNCKSLKMS